MTTTLHGTAPDGSAVSVVVDDDDQDEPCPAVGEDFSCTLSTGHAGPWHIADTGADIVGVWPIATI